MLKLKRVSSVLGMKVYTNDGDFFGNIEEVELINNRVYGWKVKPTKESTLNRALGGAKGVIVPHKLVEAVGEIMIISKTAMPPMSSNESVNSIPENEN